ncbi:MAG TPA: ribonuclease HI family protein [Dehalococcoidales bacterium]|nr:ribonuclease HI family protein [Dehalococcoidales bacterium]
MHTEKVIIFTDGASRGNPGPAAIGAVIQDEAGKPIASLSQRIGTTTNNEAEYRAIIAGLQKAVSLGAREVELKSDSELVVRQINGSYRVKAPALKPLYQQVKKLQGFVERLTITHISRRQNTKADRLANKALGPAVD